MPVHGSPSTRPSPAPSSSAAPFNIAMTDTAGRCWPSRGWTGPSPSPGDRPGQGLDRRRLRRPADRRLLRRDRRRGRRARGHRPARPVAAFGGGVPVVVDGAFVGAVGASGGSAAQDKDVAAAGAAAVAAATRDRTFRRRPAHPPHPERTHDDPVHAAGRRDRRHARGRPSRRRGDRPDARTRISRRIATGTGADRQVAIRSLAEQLVSEANAILARPTTGSTSSTRRCPMSSPSA